MRLVPALNVALVALNWLLDDETVPEATRESMAEAKTEIKRLVRIIEGLQA